MKVPPPIISPPYPPPCRASPLTISSWHRDRVLRTCGMKAGPADEATRVSACSAQREAGGPEREGREAASVRASVVAGSKACGREGERQPPMRHLV